MLRTWQYFFKKTFPLDRNESAIPYTGGSMLLTSLAKSSYLLVQIGFLQLCLLQLFFQYFDVCCSNIYLVHCQGFQHLTGLMSEPPPSIIAKESVEVEVVGFSPTAHRCTSHALSARQLQRSPVMARWVWDITHYQTLAGSNLWPPYLRAYQSQARLHGSFCPRRTSTLPLSIINLLLVERLRVARSPCFPLNPLYSVFCSWIWSKRHL